MGWLIQFLVLQILCGGVCGYRSIPLRDPEVCPTWFIAQVINGTVSCVCGVSTEGVVCDQYSNRSMLRSDYCITSDDNQEHNSTVIGSCPYNDHKPDFNQQYKKLPRNVSGLNEFMCGELNRTGILCSHCKPGLGPAVLFSTMECLECLISGMGWLLFILIAIIPTTVLFLVVVLCQIRLSTGPLNVFVFISQALVSMVNNHPYSYILTSKPANYITKLVLTICGIFNLDFFYYIIPPFCVSSQLTTIQVISLQYIVAFWPLFLVVVSYVCIQLHARGCRVLIYLWRPFQRCCVCIETRWNIDPKASLVHAFASFLLLSYSKILFVSCILLHFISIHNITGSTVGPYVVYYNASVPFFSTQHFPYIILALFVLATFTVLPLVIFLLYPTRVFQHCLGCCNARLQHAVRTFMDAFQGYYKDGTTGTPDWRCFSGLYLIFRIMVVTTHIFPGNYKSFIRFLCLATASLMFGLLRPYKENWVNFLDSVVFFLYFIGEATYYYGASLWFCYILAAVPPIYICTYMIGKLLLQTRVIHRCALLCKFSRCEVRNDVVAMFEEENSPANEDYKPLLATAGDHVQEGDRNTGCDTISAHGASFHSYGSM